MPLIILQREKCRESYKGIEGPGFEMVGLRRLFLTGNIDKERQFHLLYFTAAILLYHLPSSVFI